MNQKSPGSGLATAALVCGLLSVILAVLPLPFFSEIAIVLGVLGIIFAAVAKSKGASATAGLVLAIIGTALAVLMCALCAAICAAPAAPFLF